MYDIRSDDIEIFACQPEPQVPVLGSGPIKGISAKAGYEHETVNHGAGEYVDGDCHVNGVEGFWALK